MALRHTPLPLFDSSNYKYTIALEEDYFTLAFTYNEVMQLYTITLSDVEGVVLKAGVGLVPNYPIMLDYAIPNLTGGFVLLPLSDSSKEFYKLYPDQIHKYYTLSYVYDDSN